MLRRPVKYNPDKRDFVLNKANLDQLSKQPGMTNFSNHFGATAGATGPMSTNDDIFETSSEMSRTDSQYSYGNRISQFGFTDMFGQQRRYEERSERGAAMESHDQPTRKQT